MTSPSVASLLQFVGLKPNLLPANSRYQSVAIASMRGPDGGQVQYLRRRFVPQPDKLAQVQQHTVLRNDRLDIIAARYLGDPELFWRICDANGAMRPEDLLAEPGRALRIAMPEGISGGPRVP